ncbi:MAG: putative lipoprotein [Verrucomicrobiales bacterium]|nr:putative lipoprotein [Verrucomicrobiales bacterium]
MKTRSVKSDLITVFSLGGLLLFMGAAQPQHPSPKDVVARGKYLVEFGGCNDCHTPLKFTDKGPVPDMARMLSGHPEQVQLPPPDLKPGPWFAATAGMTAWTGPWGISYSANLTPDTNTGLGIWTEEMFIQAMRIGKHMGSGREILPPMPWRSLSTLDDGDLKAIFAYLKSVPAISNHVPAPSGPPGMAQLE